MSRLSAAPVALAALLVPALAFAAAPVVGDAVGDTPEAVRAALTEKGCEVRKTESEDGQLEVYAVCDGRRLEVYVSGGEVTRVKGDD